MFRIDTPTAAATLPAPAAAGTPGFFQGGNPTTGVPPTTVSPDWFNEVQEELVAVIVAAGFTLNKGANNQLLSALQAMFAPLSGFASSFGASGYQKLPGGLILQWKTITLTTGANVTSTSVTWPIAFPTAILGNPWGNASNDANGAWQACVLSPRSGTTTGCTVKADTANTGQSITNSIPATIFAIGY